MGQDVIEDLGLPGRTRQSFARNLGVLSAAAASGGTVEAQAAIQDSDILNFALNLEYLKAEFYTMATTGMTLAQYGNGISLAGTGNAGATTGGSQVAFTDDMVRATAMELARDERDHVTLLQKALAQILGADSIAKPAINLNALGIGFANQTQFVTLARAFEDIGVTAYGERCL